MLTLVLACSTVDKSSPSITEEDTGAVHGEDPPIGPNDTVFSGIDYDENYSRIAVGNVARAVDDPGCCFDYVLAGPGVENVRVVFGGGGDTGLVFLDDRPDEVLTLGLSDDVALVDLNEDGRSDLIALGDDHELDVRLGIADPGPDGPFLAQDGVATPATAELRPGLVGQGADDLATGDIDADGHIDVVVAAPQGGVIVLWGRGDGAFEAVTGDDAQTAQQLGPVRVVVAQLDGAGGEDVATANADGSFTVLRGAQGDRDFDTTQRHVLRPVQIDPCQSQLSCWNDTASAVITAGPFCVGPGLDLAYAYEDKVWIICGTNGQFGNVGEEPHGSGVGPDLPVADYRFDLNGPSQANNGVIDDIFVIDDDLYVLRMPEGLSSQTFIQGAHRIVHLTIDANNLDQGKGEPVLELYAATQRVVLHPASIGGNAMRLAWPTLGLARWRVP